MQPNKRLFAGILVLALIHNTPTPAQAQLIESIYYTKVNLRILNQYNPESSIHQEFDVYNSAQCASKRGLDTTINMNSYLDGIEICLKSEKSLKQAGILEKVYATPPQPDGAFENNKTQIPPLWNNDINCEFSEEIADPNTQLVFEWCETITE